MKLTVFSGIWGRTSQGKQLSRWSIWVDCQSSTKLSTRQLAAAIVGLSYRRVTGYCQPGLFDPLTACMKAFEVGSCRVAIYSSRRQYRASTTAGIYVELTLVPSAMVILSLNFLKRTNLSSTRQKNNSFIAWPVIALCKINLSCLQIVLDEERNEG